MHERGAASLFAILLSLQLSACASPAPANFDLVATQSTLAQRKSRGQLAILRPEASKPADSDQIVVRLGSQSIAYLTGGRWVEQLPALVQSRLIESFQNAHLLKEVGPPGIAADYNLQTTIRSFDFDPSQNIALVEIAAQILSSNGRIKSGRLFSARVPVTTSDPATVAAALNAALREVMRDIVAWAAPQV